MIKPFSAVFFLVLVSLTLGGCNQQAAQQDQAQAALAQAVTAVGVAEQGYIPVDDDIDTHDVLTYRNQMLGQSLPALDSALAVGSPDQQAAAGRLKALVLLSEARFEMRQAIVAYAQLAPHAVSLLRYLVTVDRADADVVGQNVDETDMLNTLSRESKVQNARKKTLINQARTLHASIAELTSQANTFRGTSRQHRADAANLSRQAFTAKGDARFDLANQAADETAIADKASTEADKVAAKMDQLSVALKLTTAEQKLVDQVIARLDERAREAKASEAAHRAAHAQAQKEQTSATQTLTEHFDQVTQAYAVSVDQPLLSAGKRTSQAITTLEQAVHVAPPAHRRATEEDLLAAMTTQVHILTEHAAAARNFGATLSVIASAGDRLLPQMAVQTQETYDDLMRKQSQIIDTARDVITQGTALADRLGSDDALKQKAFLQAYTQRLDTAELK